MSSYPPCFRQNTNQSSDQILNSNLPGEDYDREQEDPLPVIDLRRIELGKLNEACTDWGIFRLVNHGIPLTLMSEVHEHAVRVFELGFESKQTLFASIPTTSLSYFWGTPALTPSGVPLHKVVSDDDHHQTAQETVAFKNHNWVEGFNLPLRQPSNLQLDQHPLLRDFRKLLEEYGVHQERIARSVFDAMSQTLRLSSSSEENDACLSPSTGLLRVYRYPRCFYVNQQQVWGMKVHTDSSLVTILNQYEVGGLQVLSEKDGAWIDAKPIPNTLLLHLGDMMQAISDDKYQSVKHRVRVNTEKERISIGYFVFPEHDYVIRSSTYKPFTYSDFRAQVQHDIKTLGDKVGLSRFKLNDNF